MKETKLSRRAFLGLGATAAVAAGAAGLAGCAPQQGAGTASAEGNGGSGSAAASSVSPTNYTPDFLTPPEVPTDIKEEKDCDVLVIGMGLAGTAAAKEAAEAGKKVIVLEKQPEDSYSVISMAGDFGVVGSQIQKDLGIEWAPKADIMNEYVKETGGRCDTWMMSYWYDHSGEDFDWFIEGADYEVLKSTAANRETDKPNFIRPKCFPKLETYDYKEEVYPYFHGTITTNPNMQWACEAAFNAALAAGAELIYEAEGEQLIKEGDAVVGAYAKTKDGYLKVNAKATVLCCGDYGANTEMRHYYAPWTEEFMGGVDDGRGQLMGIWAGGWMELGPHAPPHGRRPGRGQLPAAQHGGQALHERGRARPEHRRRAHAPAGRQGPRACQGGREVLADLRQQVARADHPHARRPRLHHLLRSRRQDRRVRDRAVRLRSGLHDAGYGGRSGRRQMRHA